MKNLLKNNNTKIIILAIAIIFNLAVFYAILRNDSIETIQAKSNKEILSNIKNKDLGEKHEIGFEDFSGQESEQIKTAKILFLGDLMFDRSIRQFAASKGNEFIFEKINDVLKNADLAVANLEGPITGNNSISVGTSPGEKGHFFFTFDPKLVATLSEKNIKLVNLGNNHINNFGSNGIEETKKNLEQSEVSYFGDLSSSDSITVIKEINGIKLGFVNYNQFTNGSFERALKNVSEIKSETNAIVVFTHWGNEYQNIAGKEIQNLAHRFIEQGADLVIGTHPHVIQQKEDYQGKTIYYSLGNFVFDQYFSEPTKRGLGVMATINLKGEKIVFEEIELKMKNNGQTELASQYVK